MLFIYRPISLHDQPRHTRQSDEEEFYRAHGGAGCRIVFRFLNIADSAASGLADKKQKRSSGITARWAQ